MSALARTDHAATRMAQRGIRLRDADLIALIGTEVSDGYLVLAKDCLRVEQELKEFIGRVRRLEGKRLVVVEGRIVTAYPVSRRSERRLLSRIYDRDLS